MRDEYPRQRHLIFRSDNTGSNFYCIDKKDFIDLQSVFSGINKLK